MIVCKTYLTAVITTTIGSSTSSSASLSAVCRGEENKDWARWTPSGVFTIPLDGSDDVAPLVTHDTPGPQGRPEFLLTIGDVGQPEWRFVSLSFDGHHEPGGCKATFRRPNGYSQPGLIEVNINAGPATDTLRRLYAKSLEVGEPARVGVIARPA